jgi:hypothetical protein
MADGTIDTYGAKYTDIVLFLNVFVSALLSIFAFRAEGWGARTWSLQWRLGKRMLRC